jgi:hypothetical protein
VTARWLALSVDVTDADRMTGFWAGATGLEPSRVDDEGFVELQGGPEGSELVVCPVPEPRTVKQRVHLDLHCRSVGDLEALGATVADDSFPWTVMRDPEGGELCAFVRDEVPAYKVYEVVVDCADPERVARWWGRRFGVEPRHEGDDWSLEAVPGMPFECLVLVPVPEPKVVKNRVHWDLVGDVEEFLAAGATVLWEMPRWTVMADPEGNEFCVFPEG